MSIQRLFSAICGVLALTTVAVPVNAQMTEQAAREQASNIVRSELHSRLNSKSDQFLSIHRDEELEESLAIAAVGWRSGPVFIYKASPMGVEIKENSIVNHVATDTDFMYMVAVSSANGNAYRIHGFGLTESLAEFEKFMIDLKVRIASPDQAESLADFYRKVNPENCDTLAPVTSLMDFKQIAERHCQIDAKLFDDGERMFATWWKHAKPQYTALSFQPKVVPHEGGYIVEWTVLSSRSDQNCGGAPLRAQLEVGSDGHVHKLTFSPQKGGA